MNYVGRPELNLYEKNGYVPYGKTAYSASTSLDDAYDDWCVAQVAKVLGKTSDYDVLMKRTQNYKTSCDPRNDRNGPQPIRPIRPIQSALTSYPVSIQRNWPTLENTVLDPPGLPGTIQLGPQRVPR